MADKGFPKIIDDNPTIIRSQVISEYEQEAKKKLFPAQADNFLLNELSYREALTKSQFNSASKQNYLRWAEGVLLDALGEFWGVKRLEEETDDKYRIRIGLAPEALTTTGTRGAYEFHIRSVDPSISAVSFDTPNPGSGWVQSYILTDTGLPTQDLLNRVYRTITSEKIHVLGVGYLVSAPSVIEYELKVKIISKEGYDTQSVKQDVLVALEGVTDEDGNKTQEGFIDLMQKELGTDLIPSQFSEVIQNVEGVHSVTILSPVETILPPSTWAKCTLIEVDVTELIDDYHP